MNGNMELQWFFQNQVILKENNEKIEKIQNNEKIWKDSK